MKNGASVKIQRKTHKKQYLQGKGTYKYERLYLPIPKRFNELLKPFLNQTLNIEVKNEADCFAITLSKKLAENSKTPRKNVSVPRNVFTELQGYTKMSINVIGYFLTIFPLAGLSETACVKAQGKQWKTLSFQRTRSKA